MRLYVVFRTLPTTDIASSEFYEWVKSRLPGWIQYYNTEARLTQGIILGLHGLLYVGFRRRTSRETRTEWYLYDSYEPYDIERSISCLLLGSCVIDQHLIEQLNILSQLDASRHYRL